MIVLFKLSFVRETAQFLFRTLPRNLGTTVSISDTESGTNVGRGSKEKVIAPEGWLSNLALLLKVIHTNGKSLPVGSFTVRVVVDQIKKLTGFNATEVEIMNGQDVVIDFNPEIPVVKVTQKMHGPISWEGMNSKISCLMSTKKSVLSIVNDREESRNLQKELQEQREARKKRENMLGN